MSKNLKNKIMKRIYAIWFFKKIAPAVFLYMPFLLFVAIRETANEFFVVKIIDNFLLASHGSGFSGIFSFIYSAILNTSVLPTLIILVSMGVFVILFRRLIKNFKDIYLVKSY